MQAWFGGAKHFDDGDLCQKPPLKAATLTFFVVGFHFWGVSDLLLATHEEWVIALGCSGTSVGFCKTSYIFRFAILGDWQLASPEKFPKTQLFLLKPCWSIRYESLVRGFVFQLFELRENPTTFLRTNMISEHHPPLLEKRNSTKVSCSLEGFHEFCAICFQEWNTYYNWFTVANWSVALELQE